MASTPCSGGSLKALTSCPRQDTRHALRACREMCPFRFSELLALLSSSLWARRVELLSLRRVSVSFGSVGSRGFSLKAVISDCGELESACMGARKRKMEQARQGDIGDSNLRKPQDF